jgi:stage II sporulation protein AA (anti-sigma F factor antagonist)
MSLQLGIEQKGRITIARLDGELDHHTAEHVRTTLDAQVLGEAVPLLLFQFADVTFMDSSGIGVVIGRYKQVHGRGGQVVLCEVSPAVARIMEMSGIYKIIQSYASEQEAIAALEGMQG